MMKRRRFELKMNKSALLVLMLMLVLILQDISASSPCPSQCTCSETQREVDCSWRGLRQLPSDLQPNIYSLNLSHNRLSDLDHRLSLYTHLRSLDVSHNRLPRLPRSLPRSLWTIRASGNRIRLLEKNDTAYHWNLRVLDLSENKLERVVFINNTLPNLRALNLSRNRFWTVPTNMPQNLELVDLSHNSLVQVLPGSLDRLSKLSRFYLHGNRFNTVSEGAFEKLQALRLITLDDNPWACEDKANISHLLDWTRHTQARVLGCPCHTWPVCGEVRLARTGGWHFSSYTLSPFGTSRTGTSRTETQDTPTAPLLHHWAENVLTSPHLTMEAPKQTHVSVAPTEPTQVTTQDPHTTHTFPNTHHVLTSSTRRTTTLRTRSVKRASQGLGRSSGPELNSQNMFLTSLLLLITSDLNI